MMSNIAESGAGLNHINGQIETLLRDINQSLSVAGDIADGKHLAGIPMPAIFDDRDINIDNVAALKYFFLRGNAVTDHVINRGTHRFGKSTVAETGGYGFLHIYYMVVTDSIQLFGANTGHHIFAD